MASDSTGSAPGVRIDNFSVTGATCP
jgi:hypothetical protein